MTEDKVKFRGNHAAWVGGRMGAQTRRTGNRVADPALMTWLANADEDRLFLSVVTLAQLRYGIERLAKGRRSHRLNVWLQDATAPF